MSISMAATEASRQFSELLRRVGEGQSFIITSDDGRSALGGRQDERRPRHRTRGIKKPGL